MVVIEEHELEAVPARALPIRRPLPRWPSRTIGVSLTVLVHLMISTPFVLGTAAHRPRPSPDGTGATGWASAGEQQSESMILLDLSALSVSEASNAPQSTPTESPLVDTPPLVLVGAEPSLPPDIAIEEDAEESDEADVAAGDPSGRAVMFGKYMGQIAARIERAWMRPRSAVDTGHFDCRARVEQDRSGNVLAVSLDECNTDAVWRRSLESAILRASPLSAPPEPALFTSSLTLNFSAEPFQAGVTPDYLYEPASVHVAALQAPLQLIVTPADETATAPNPELSGDVELTITGSQITWKKKLSATSKQ